MDYNATTPLHPKVREAMDPYLYEIWGNPSSPHEFGRGAKSAVEEARERVRALVGAKDASEIVFTSGGTESNNLAIKGIAHAMRSRGDHIITSAIEHHSVLRACQFLEAEGYQVTSVPVDEHGRVDLNALAEAITDRTILITIMWANNEVGTVQPVEEIGKIARKRGVIFHTDAVQAAGKLPISVEDARLDLVSIAAHKFYGPKGVGALYIRKETNLSSLHHGGPHERGVRAGTENVPGIVGLGSAAEHAQAELEGEIKGLSGLRDQLGEAIFKDLDGVRLNGHPTDRLCNTLNVSFDGADAFDLLVGLDLEGIAVSSGSACTSGNLEPSHVLEAMGLPRPAVLSSIRFSLGRNNTPEEIEHVARILVPLVKRLRSKEAAR